MQDVHARTADRPRAALRAVVLGNAIEWYEFGLYALLATYLGRAFFPADDPLASAIGAWGVFTVAFVVRPAGGLLLGRLGNRIGRRALLVLTVSGMGAATTALGLVPGHAAIGAAAPLLILGLRAVQGASAGAEMAAAVAYLRERGPGAAAGPAMGVLGASTYAAAGVAGVLVTVLTFGLGEESMTAWGWRVPFLLALPLALVALALRRAAPDDAPVTTVVAAPAPRARVRGVLRYGAVAGVYNVGASAVFGGYLAHARLADAAPAAAQGVAALMLFLAGATALGSGRLVRRVGTRATLVAGAATLAVAAWPAFALASTGGTGAMLAGAALVSVPVGVIVAPAYLLIASLFRPELRLVDGSLAYNITALIGGLTPVTVLLVRQQTGFTLAYPVALVAAAAIAVAASLRTLPRTGAAGPIEEDRWT